jgi:drug/metabolite transporter (DMT)-like permease
VLFLAIGILCNVILLLIIKAFERFGIPTLQGIVINYFVAGATAMLFSGVSFNVDEVVNAPFFPVSIIMGALFIAIFYLISKTAQAINISVATVANKMSVVIPVLIAFVYYGDKVTVLKVAGIIVALISVYLTTKQGEKTESKSSSLLLFPVLIFIGSGIIDSLVNYANERLVHNANEGALFTAIGFFSAGCIGICCLLYLFVVKKEKFVSKSIIAGIALGIPNFFSLYFILKALSSGILESSELYPVANVFILILSSLGGVLLFKEKLSKLNVLGIALSIIAIAMITIKLS